jgi:hypothetical protein
MKTTFFGLVSIVSLMLIACGNGNNPTDNGGSSRLTAVEDVYSMTLDPQNSNLFRVTCKYHTPQDQPELRSANEIRSNQVCLGSGMTGACSYKRRPGGDGEFRVFADGQLYTQTVHGFDFARFACTERASVLYDGDDLWIFDAVTRTFQQDFSVEDNATNTTMRSTESIVAFYDRDDLFALDLTKAALKWERYMLVKDGASLFRMEVLHAMIVSYDGDDTQYYCAGKWDRDMGPQDNDTSLTITAQYDKLFVWASNGTWMLDPTTCKLVRR